MITAEHLRMVFRDGFVAVEDADFEVQAGEVFALLGPNGAGKSTAVHLLLGHLRPTSGRALVAGVDVHDRPLEAKRHLAYVSENVLLYGALTARQNLAFFCRVSGVDVPRPRQDDVLEQVGLADDARRPVETFSKGMRQRLGIAIALAKDPPAFVMDEPASGLDPLGMRELARIVADLRGADKAILLVTHDLFRLRELADRIAVMRDGRVLPSVRASEVADVEAFYRRAMEEGPAAPLPAAEVSARGPARA